MHPYLLEWSPCLGCRLQPLSRISPGLRKPSLPYVKQRTDLRPGPTPRAPSAQLRSLLIHPTSEKRSSRKFGLEALRGPEREEGDVVRLLPLRSCEGVELLYER